MSSLKHGDIVDCWHFEGSRYSEYQYGETLCRSSKKRSTIYITRLHFVSHLTLLVLSIIIYISCTCPKSIPFCDLFSPFLLLNLLCGQRVFPLWTRRCRNHTRDRIVDMEQSVNASTRRQPTPTSSTCMADEQHTDWPNDACVYRCPGK